MDFLWSAEAQSLAAVARRACVGVGVTSFAEDGADPDPREGWDRLRGTGVLEIGMPPHGEHHLEDAFCAIDSVSEMSATLGLMLANRLLANRALDLLFHDARLPLTIGARWQNDERPGEVGVVWVDRGRFGRFASGAIRDDALDVAAMVPVADASLHVGLSALAPGDACRLAFVVEAGSWKPAPRACCVAGVDDIRAAVLDGRASAHQAWWQTCPRWRVRQFAAERCVLLAAALIGVARGAFARALGYSTVRHTFSRPLYQHQAIGTQLADMAMSLEMARWLTIDLAGACGRGRRCESAPRVWRAVRDLAVDVGWRAMHVRGGHGYLRACAAERAWRHLHAIAIVGDAADAGVDCHA
jgi:hypothetical protein